jgi:hypothetical protein
MFCRKNNRVACATKAQVATTSVILARMSQQEAEHRRGHGGDPVRKDAWAPVLADSGTHLGDVLVECEEEDPHRVWRLETLLKHANATASEQKRWNETLHDSLAKKGVTIGKQEGEIERLQEENERLQEEIERLRDESVVAKENERLRAAVLLAAKAAANVAKLVEDLEVVLDCPLSLGQMKDPVVSIYGHSYERGYIDKWLKKKWKCPITGQKLTKAHMPINRALTDVANAFNAYMTYQRLTKAHIPTNRALAVVADAFNAYQAGQAQ